MEPVHCVIVAFHDPNPLARLLGTLAHPGVDALVVNVEADPAVAAVAATAGVGHLALDGNPGYAAAVNAGAERFDDGLVVFMNDDLEASAEHVLALASVVGSGEADVAMPAVVNGAGHTEGVILALPTPASLAWEWLLLPDAPVPWMNGHVQVEKWRRPDRPERVDAASAFMVATSARLLHQVPLPVEYFLYWEESEWFWWLQKAGAVVQVRPDVVVRHGGGREDVRPDKSRLMARNAVRCVRRTQGRMAAALAVPVVVAWNLRLVVTAAVHRREFLGARLAGLRAAVGAWTEVAR
ncbi:MAG: glycosyltransferase family 2 protein [Acidimicrobiales bacterium]